MKKLILLLIFVLLSSPAFAARYCDGVDDDIDFPTGTYLTINGDLSIGLWLRFSSASSSGDAILESGGNGETSGTNAYWLESAGSSGAWDIDYNHESGAGVNNVHTFNTNVGNDTWTYVAISRDATAKTVKMWTSAGGDLSLIESWGYTNDPAGGGDSGNKLQLCDYFGSFYGEQELAELKIYDRILTIDEHQQNMVGQTVFGNLKLSTPLHGTSTTEADLSGSTHNGTVAGATVVDHPPVGPSVRF